MATPANQGAFYAMTETTAGTYLAPTQGSDDAIKLLEEPTIATVPALVEQSRPTTLGGGSAPISDRYRWDVACAVPLSGINASREVDWLPLMKACAVTLATTSPSGGVGLSIAPNPAWNVPSNNAGSPQLVSTTFVEGGGGAPYVYRTRGAAARWAGLAHADGVVRMNFELHGLVPRDTGADISVVPRGDTSFTMAAATFQSIANHPEFKPRLTATIGGDDFNCISELAFDPGLSLDERPCDQETDGFDPSFSVPGAATLAVTIEQPDDPLVADMRTGDQTGAIVLTWERVIGDITWRAKLTLPAAVVVGVERGGDTMRTSAVVFQALQTSGSNQWTFLLERIDATP